jgi:negative regulator of genetic competence, sporulation and motility
MERSLPPIVESGGRGSLEMGRILQELQKQKRSDFKFPWTRNELWMFDQSDHTAMCVVSGEDVDEIVWSSHRQRKMMFTAFISRTGQFFLNVQWEGQIMDRSSFAEGVVADLNEFHDPQVRNPRQRKAIRHDDKASIHKQ